MLLCDRPHVKTVDFRNARFVVCKALGLDINGQHLEMGDEVPVGVLSIEAAQQLYDTPMRLIETFDYAAKVPDLASACTRRGIDLTQSQTTPATPEPVQASAATEMCDECGEFFTDLSKHSRKECKRIRASRVRK